MWGSVVVHGSEWAVDARVGSAGAAIELVGRRWNGAIVVAADEGACRYSEFLATVPGISERVLAQRLRELEADRILVRDVVASRPVLIRYTLSERGRDLARAVRPLIEWGERWLAGGPEEP
jgi:DNA-binding HxlR family transcriptional regulator